jgi:hypothetical protein
VQHTARLMNVFDGRLKKFLSFIMMMFLVIFLMQISGKKMEKRRKKPMVV